MAKTESSEYRDRPWLARAAGFHFRLTLPGNGGFSEEVIALGVICGSKNQLSA